jgi:5-oxoprolinase (ATP-hydrolysing)
MKKWSFWVDRGGTFTDLLAKTPDGRLLSHKLLSENPAQYEDATLHGIRELMAIPHDQALPVEQIASVRMGTTVATNALLEKKGTDVLFVTNQGFKDALSIAYQQRPDLFALNIPEPNVLYQAVITVSARVDAQGNTVSALDEAQTRQQLQQAYDQGLRAVAVVLMHGYRYPQQEQRIGELAADMGFTQVSLSHETSRLIKFVRRGDTTVLDAYLSPILQRYVQRLSKALPNVELLFMQSNGALTAANDFHGKDAILSGPAGGVVGMVETAKAAGFHQLIGFDMGGTSTDVCHYAEDNHYHPQNQPRDYERTLSTEIAGIRIGVPMMQIHTVAAGGGSLLHFDGYRFQVGPDSAGANPGPVAYRKGQQLTVTDCNVMLGKLQPAFFPKIFGEQANQSLDQTAVTHAFQQFADEIAATNPSSISHQSHYLETIAEGFLTVAVENMANAIKQISVQRGYDVTQYTLCCFGGAGGQHACLVADVLGMQQIYLHPYAGILSAYGMGLASIGTVLQDSLAQVLDETCITTLPEYFQQLKQSAEAIKLQKQAEQASPDQQIHYAYRLACHYIGSDSTLDLVYQLPENSKISLAEQLYKLQQTFTEQHQQLFGFCLPDRPIAVARIELAINVYQRTTDHTITTPQQSSCEPIAYKPVFMQGCYQQTPFYQREYLPANAVIQGPAIILEKTGTIVIEPNWQAERHADGGLVLQRKIAKAQREPAHLQENLLENADHIVDPVLLALFSKRFMSIAEQMGYVLEKTAVSVNIKERLDFSCAIFDANGQLVANALHMPVHLGSMSESIKTIIRDCGASLQPDDVYLLNAPYNGGTHLPDVTVIKPIFATTFSTQLMDSSTNNLPKVLFYVAARGHHADIGGITPGSIPADSTHINQEGILLDKVKLVDQGVFQEAAIRALLASGDYPARNIDYNIADFKAQLAACEKGSQALQQLIEQESWARVSAYMQHVQDHAEQAVRDLLPRLSDGEFCYPMDDGTKICVVIRIDRQEKTATIDFTGTSPQHAGNLNAPVAVVKAAVLYVFRCLVEADIPLNEGCLKPLQIHLPDDCVLNPCYPAAVVAGNVETSQYIVDTLFAALGIMGAAQGTMNNVTWGNADYQYYETLCGGAGATAQQAGRSAIHTHMTNSRLTDPEILESRFPVRLDEFAIRNNSGGKGQYKGGDGVIRKTRFLQKMTVNILSDHRITPPYGMNGGEQGVCGENSIEKASGEHQPLGSKAQINVECDDVLVIKTPSGGGFGKVYKA